MRKTLSAEIKAQENRTFRVRASDGGEDRDHDRIKPEGWTLANFRRNPVILWQHNHDIPAIARANTVAAERGALMATIEFAPQGIHPIADQVHDLVAAGFINSVSVGFQPLKHLRNELGGTDFVEQDLLEISWVNVPAHAGALVVGRSADAAAVAKWLHGGDDEVVLYLADSSHDDPVVLHLTDDTDEVTFDPRDVASALRDELPKVIGDSLRDVVREAVTREVARRRGRINPLADPFVPAIAQRSGAEDLRATIAEAVQRGLRQSRGRID